MQSDIPVEQQLQRSPTGTTTASSAASNDRLPFVSVVDSPFGLLALTVSDPSSYFPLFPVFADDAGEQDVSELLDNALGLLDAVQVCLFVCFCGFVNGGVDRTFLANCSSLKRATTAQ